MNDSALDNIVNKLQIYLRRTNQTLYGLAASMGFQYQPLYRIITKKHIPTIVSVELIAKYFKCTVAELIQEKVFLDIECYDDFSQIFNINKVDMCRIYIPYTAYLPLIQYNFFAVKYSNISAKNASHHTYQVFYSIDKLLLNGEYIVEYNGQKVIMNILGISSKEITVKTSSNQEKKIDTSLIKLIAKFFNTFEIYDGNLSVSIGVKQYYKD